MNRSVGGVINTGMLMPVYAIMWSVVSSNPMYKAKVTILDGDRGVGTTIYLNVEKLL